MGANDGGRGLEQFKVLIETDTAAVLEAQWALEELRHLWIDAMIRRRATIIDTERFAELIRRIETGLGMNAQWMRELRRLAPILFRIADDITPTEPNASKERNS